ncbi:hypothetical protein KIN20_027262 [Parelaphostrongylus tenuis]|uniref:Uncharacterized protein n=1 Tax=Parelaphostrongylus tenuis TaxID=148309 RepID=A0AAD5WDM5_PARTN|nr:hypothetical protein KIN20_027262 [Parelaphostrongylus tenuis]
MTAPEGIQLMSLWTYRAMSNLTVPKSTSSDIASFFNPAIWNIHSTIVLKRRYRNRIDHPQGDLKSGLEVKLLDVEVE